MGKGLLKEFVTSISSNMHRNNLFRIGFMTQLDWKDIMKTLLMSSIHI